MSGLRGTLEKSRRVFNEEEEYELLNSRRSAYSGYDLADESNPADFAEDYNREISRNYENLLNYNRPAETVTNEISDVAPAIEPEQIELSDFDLMPTSTTMQFTDTDMGEEVFVRRGESVHKTRASFKTKVMIAVYAVVAVTLLVLIIMNSIALANMSANVSAIQAEVNGLREQSAAAGGSLDYLMQQETIISNGINSGMVMSDAATAIDVPSVPEAATVAAESNWFDSLCNFLCGIFG